jgi:1-acyl-sn-glycerol-3-phosphate acyltransferase
VNTVITGEALIEAITSFLGKQAPATLEGIHASLQREVEAAGRPVLAQLGHRLAESGTDWGYFPPDPLARRIHHVIAEYMLGEGSALYGAEHAEAVAGEPVIIFANHLSYSDANLLEILLQRAGAHSLASRLTVIAGPKVYSSLTRRFSSLCFGTIKIPQSSTVASGEAVMDQREVARAARRSIEIAHERLMGGDAVLVFAEGARSRTQGLQQMLAAASRYLDGPDALILPVGIIGTEAMFPIGEESLNPVRVVARVGAPIRASVLREQQGGNRQMMMDRVGEAIAELVPPEYRGVYAKEPA